MLAGYVVFAFFSAKRFNELFIKGLYDTTLYNFKNITESENSLQDYPNCGYDEFTALNKEIDFLKKEFDSSTLISNVSDLSHINLNYIDTENNVVSLKSFKKNIEQIIFSSQNFRNVLVELYYELNEDTLSDQEINYLLVLMRKFFNNYQNVVYIVNENHKSLYF